MLTFEKVLEVFADYISKDEVCEVVITSKGYTVMYWDDKDEDWYNTPFCKTPEIMRDTFLESYFDFLEQKYTQNKREITKEEVSEINSACEKLLNACK